ncbi:MAG: fused MFS/spermidine synthase [Candidatus Sumerlaeaceae bacterium]|nr:fused MFS/spermidine synthase [Candidatus Sumerlaeaceae bacterium]
MTDTTQNIPASTPRRPGIAIVIYLLFLATGMSGLIYQVVWQRYLLNIFGSTIYSISTVLSAFMGGLALGSWLFGRWAEKSRRPLLAYGAFEVLIGAMALAVPLMLRVLDPLFGAIYQSIGSNFLLFSLVRFVVVFVVLLIPTTLMGGTLPLLAKFVSPHGGGAGLRVGLLYSLNTFGAVFGTFLSGFYLIRHFGISKTVAIAAGINFAAGVIALLLSKAFVGSGASGSTSLSAIQLSPAARRRVALILITYFISGFAALGLEVAWSRALVFTFELLKNTTYAFTAMLTTFLVGIALGSAVMTPLADRQRNPLRLFAALQVLIGFAAILSFFMIYFKCYSIGEDWIREYDNSDQGIRWNASILLVFLKTSAAMLLPTFCMGLAFPVAVRAIAEETGGAAASVGRLYALNTLGAILGSFATGFLLLPSLGIGNTIFLLGALQLLAGVALVVLDETETGAQKAVLPILGAAALVVGFIYMPRPTRFQRDTALERIIHYKEGPLATVSVGENSLGFRTIYVDNVGVAGTDPMLLTDQKSLAHVPMLLLENPKSALTVGFGSGGASYSYTLYPEMERVDCVEITKTVVEAAPTLVDSNHNIVMYRPEYRRRTGQDPPGMIPLWNDGGASGWYKLDKRYGVVLDDARSYLRLSGAKYDIIATDCTDLRYKSNANLYDLEYFKLTREHITDDGMVVVWMPLGGLSDEAMRVALRTFYKVFPEMQVFYMNNEPTHYILLLGTKKPLTVDVDLLKKRLGQGAVAKDLAEIHLNSPEKILSCFVNGPEGLSKVLAGDLLNTEDFPYLEFESPRFGYGDAPILDNLDTLYKFANDPAKLVKEPEKHGEFLKSLEKYMSAVPDIIAGHRFYRKVQVHEANAAYMAAAAKNPVDSSVKKLLNFDELVRRAQGQPNDLFSRAQLGFLLSEQKRDSEAVTYLNELIQLYDSLPGPQRDQGARYMKPALEELSKLYERNGQPDKAAEFKAKAAKFPAPKADDAK